MAAFLSSAPWLVALSRHKGVVFAVSGILIVSNFVYVYWIAPRLRAQSGACAPDGLAACSTASQLSRTVLWISGALYLFGFFTAFVLGPILARFD